MNSPLAESKPTQRDLARVLGISEALVSKLFRQGVFRRHSTLAELVQAFVTRAEQLAEASSAGGDDALERERIGLYRARKEMAELEVAEKRSELIPAAAVLDAWARMLGSVKARLLAMPNKTAPRARGAATDAHAVLVIEAEVIEALEELSSDGLPAKGKR